MTEDQQNIVSNVLMDAWQQAERDQDDEVAEACKAALDELGLPWVRKHLKKRVHA